LQPAPIRVKAATMDDPVFDSRAALESACGPRGVELAVAGLWRCGTLAGLANPCVAIVGTRAATPYGRRLTRSFAERLGAAGCCIVSGLALGIDSEAHEGALRVNAPTIGVLGSGHRQFFPRRNTGLAERMLAGGGAVLSPFAPDDVAYPSQFLERNAIVAALCDAVVVIEAPARSGALNTAGWAAGRIPVFAVPGDVDRAHVQGCLALIRDGAILARHAGDVLEALGRQGQLPLPLAPRSTDPIAARLLSALEGGERDLDSLVEETGILAPAVMAALAMLELAGTVERRGATCYAIARCSCD
jgi:DNA processing protein